jgi:long-chain acyl-CoA synthetase
MEEFFMSNTLSPAPWLKIHEELGVEPAPLDDRPLGVFLEDHALNIPDCVALQLGDQGMTYAELNGEVNRLANALLALGVGEGDVIGLHMPNIAPYCIALGAIAKIGCAGSGVSPLLAPAELAYQVQDAGISVLITLDDLQDTITRAAGKLPDCLEHVIQTSADTPFGGEPAERESLAGRQTHDYLQLTRDASGEFAQRAVEWNDTFMIQYTGGTTGRPKGAELSVRNLMNNPEMFNAYEHMDTGNEVYASAFPFFHVAGLAISINCMRYGARLLLIPNARDVEFFCRQMQAYPPTRMAGVPTLYMMIVNNPESGNIDFSQLKTAISGAAPLPAEDRKHIEKLLGPGVFGDVYGMTETSPIHVLNPPKRSLSTAIGIPVPGADTRIVDLETGTIEMPRGEPGEIITSGIHVMKGYLNLPEESAKALREWQGKTWMYSGDVGFMDEDGYISICDRAKDMLIVGGFKVFSVEIEDKLKEVDAVAESAVVGTPDEARPGNDIVNLYVQLSPDAAARDPDEVRSEIIGWCRENLSPYKVPKNVQFIDAIPLTVVGKIDKKVLRDLAAQG